GVLDQIPDRSLKEQPIDVCFDRLHRIELNYNARFATGGFIKLLHLLEFIDDIHDLPIDLSLWVFGTRQKQEIVDEPRQSLAFIQRGSQEPISLVGGLR